ncbi:DUF6153 family protein [Microbacterium sp. NPDC076768]|uniref:DUF6153 family protein n=1 Tax=Microbacterium sp. NPDC076768 TaxID=3154858 RepID=UPI00341B4F4C
MYFAHSATRQRLSLRSLLLLAGAVFVIIVGLLGMHVLSAGSMGHHTVSAEHSATTVSSLKPVTTPISDAHTSPCDETCVIGSEGAHLGMVTGCVLALLVGLLLLLRPLLLLRFRAAPRGFVFSLRATVDRAFTQAPSLIFLSISRT